MRCEDYPCCGHGPPPWGDGGGCPDAEGRFNCCDCGRKLPKGASSALCKSCMRKVTSDDFDDYPSDDGY
jgi:hypothetical protein